MTKSEGMHVTFWGVRGTVPVAGVETSFYGGNTSCVEVRCGTHTIILDAGTGINVLSRSKAIDDCDILLSHTHIDHIQGFPVFAPLYKKGSHVRVWEGHLESQFRLPEVLGRIMSAPIFPLTLESLQADVSYHHFDAGDAVTRDAWDKAGIVVRSIPLHHPDGATGYRIEYQGDSLCYITDYEHDNEPMHAALHEFVAGCDCLIYDATYSAENYDQHEGWGHSTWQAGDALAKAADVKSLILFHHDPDINDSQLQLREKELTKSRQHIVIAREGMTIDFSGEGMQIHELDINIEQSETEAMALIDRLTYIGTSLSLQKNLDHLLEHILLEAMDITGADGGTLYLCDDAHRLHFSIVRNHSLDIAYGGSTDTAAPIEPIDLQKAQEEPYRQNVAAYCAVNKIPVHIEDIYLDGRFNFEGVKQFDREHHYQTQSLFAVPMTNHKGEVLGCLQLINAQDADEEIIGFDAFTQKLVFSLASQASIILDNKILIQDQKNLLEAFIKMIAKAIDAKSPYTGAHCERVPTLTNMLADAACEATSGPLKDFNLTEEEKYELHIAGWMHDCGKIVTPVHIIDKSTKLETIWDRIDLVIARMEIALRDLRIHMLEASTKDGANIADLTSEYEASSAALKEDAAFIRKINIGGEFMHDEDLQRLDTLVARWGYHDMDGVKQPVINKNEHYNLQTQRGTLTHEERTIMNDHMVHTCAMLEALPFPKHLRRVPEYAGGHHERMDGKGYPKGLMAGEMSIPARMMAVADVFEALTAADRPYKPGKKLSDTMNIIGKMKQFHHLDPMIVDFFITSKVYLDYAKKYLTDDLIDTVDEAALMAIKPAK